MNEQLTFTLEPPKVEHAHPVKQLESDQLAADALRIKLFYSEKPQLLLPPPESGHLLPNGQHRMVH